MERIQLATRNWDHVIPLALGDVPQERYAFERREITPDLWSEPGLDGGETSFSRYIRARAAGDYSVTALPVFIMRGFRHRCIITRTESPFETAADLRGARIGLTGWVDTGNTWTRAVLRQAGVGIADAEWRVGRLTGAHPIQDRIGAIAVPENVRPCENEEPMVDMLLRGALDAVMTPFMPPGFYEPGSPLRTLYRDSRAAEADYFRSTGFVPGIHLLAVQTRVLEENPAAAQELVDLFESSRILSDSRRGKLQDITPWQNEAIAETTRVFGANWMATGWKHNQLMISGLQTEMIDQGLLAGHLSDDALFPFKPEPSEALS